nr:hypothetical protein [Microbacterium hydrocarbonoxydans]
MDNPLIFVVLIAALIVLSIFLPRWVRRSSTSAGSREERRVADSRRADALRDLGTTLVLDAPETVVREMVDTIVWQRPREFTVLDDGSYGIRFVEPDDAVVRLVTDGSTTRMRVERSREHLGMPQGASFWNELRALVTARAAAEGVGVTTEPGRANSA